MPSPARLIVALSALALAAPAAAAPGVAVAPAPAWVEPVALPDAPAPSTSDAGGATAFLLVDEQFRRGPAGLEHYRRRVSQVLATSGIEEASEVRIDFDPAYQSVTIHGVVIRRGKKRLPALRPAEIRTIQREADLDRRVYDGRRTAILFLHDVRVGDVVDVTWTVRGQNPVFGGRSTIGLDLGWDVPVSRLSLRVLWPEDRPLAVRVHGDAPGPTRSVRRGTVEYRLVRSPAPAAQGESDLPPGVTPYPWLEFSEWSSWEEVVAWALPLYAPAPITPAMSAKLAEWRRLPRQSQQVQAALRFVQDEVRYLGIELGTSSHRPTPAGEVLQRRFGDCKDKSLLLVTLLRELGVEAAPALVHSDDQAAVGLRLPSPVVFDHVVVRARVDGAERWLEPTRSLERGPIADLVPPPYRLGLVLAPGEKGLVQLPEPPPSLVEVNSAWKVAAWNRPVGFEVVTRYEGLRALGMRHLLADTTPAKLQRRYLEHYARDEPGVEVAEPLRVVDAPDADRVTITERYWLPGQARDARRDFNAEAIQERLVLPRTARRALPLRVAYPALVREHLELELPGMPAIKPDDQVVKGDAVQLTRRARTSGKRYLVDFEYRTLQTTVEPPAVAGHLAKVRAMQDLANFSLPLSVVSPTAAGTPAAARRPSGGVPGWVTTLVLVGVILVGRGLFVVARKQRAGGPAGGWTGPWSWGRRRTFLRKFSESPGESARNPIEVGNASELPTRTGGLRCACGTPVSPSMADVEQLQLGDRTIAVARATCGRCRVVTPVYFVVGAGHQPTHQADRSQPPGPLPALPTTLVASPFGGPPTWPAWRSGKALVLRHGARFPRRCVKCNGAAAELATERTVYWHHPGWYLLIPAGILVYAIAALVVRRKATVDPGLCALHRKRRRAWIAVGWLGPIAGVYLMAASWSGSAGAVIGALLGLAAIVLGMVMAQIVAPRRIDEQFVHLGGCGEPFLAGLPSFPDQGRG